MGPLSRVFMAAFEHCFFHLPGAESRYRERWGTRGRLQLPGRRAWGHPQEESGSRRWPSRPTRTRGWSGRAGAGCCRCTVVVECLIVHDDSYSGIRLMWSLIMFMILYDECHSGIRLMWSMITFSIRFDQTDPNTYLPLIHNLRYILLLFSFSFWTLHLTASIDTELLWKISKILPPGQNDYVVLKKSKLIHFLAF